PGPGGGPPRGPAAGASAAAGFTAGRPRRGCPIKRGRGWGWLRGRASPGPRRRASGGGWCPWGGHIAHGGSDRSARGSLKQLMPEWGVLLSTPPAELKEALRVLDVTAPLEAEECTALTAHGKRLRPHAGGLR